MESSYRKDGNNALSLSSATDYYPYGMPMPGRSLTGSEGYRYAFQGQERDPETGKEAFELRLWDGRIGRWLTTDPKKQYVSPYLGMGNNPVNKIDPDGGKDESSECCNDLSTWFRDLLFALTDLGEGYDNLNSQGKISASDLKLNKDLRMINGVKGLKETLTPDAGELNIQADVSIPMSDTNHILVTFGASLLLDSYGNIAGTLNGGMELTTDPSTSLTLNLNLYQSKEFGNKIHYSEFSRYTKSTTHTMPTIFSKYGVKLNQLEGQSYKGMGLGIGVVSKPSVSKNETFSLNPFPISTVFRW